MLKMVLFLLAAIVIYLCIKKPPRRQCKKCLRTFYKPKHKEKWYVDESTFDFETGCESRYYYQDICPYCLSEEHIIV